MLIKLGNADIKTRDNLADLSGDELRDVLGEKAPSIEEINKIIMKAREHWFKEED